jgi:menaquinol-cytochrome c reductase iron-sulfur subunit
MSTTDAGRPANPERRKLFARISVAAGAAVGAMVAVPALVMYVGPMFRQLQQPWRPVGPVNNFRIGDTVQVTIENVSSVPWSGLTSQTAVWLRRDNEQSFTAFSVNCAHLGCPVSWKADAELFMCPCHGGTYYADGSVAAGPPPHGLDKYPVRVQNGQVEIQASPLPL